MLDTILKSFEVFVMEPISILRRAIIQVVGVQTNDSSIKSLEIEKVDNKIQLNVINSDKMYNLLTTVMYKRNLNNKKKQNVKNQKSQVYN